MTAKAKVEERVKEIPRVVTRHAGRINHLLESLGDSYKKTHPDMDCRWVYHPEHKRELSNVIGRKASGYRKVMRSDLPEEMQELIENESEVRVGDVILMKISREVRDEMRKELAERAQDQAKSVDRKFRESLELAEKGPDGTVHQATPRGSAKIEEKEFEYDIEQKGG